MCLLVGKGIITLGMPPPPPPGGGGARISLRTGGHYSKGGGLHLLPLTCGLNGHRAERDCSAVVFCCSSHNAVCHSLGPMMAWCWARVLGQSVCALVCASGSLSTPNHDALA